MPADDMGGWVGYSYLDADALLDRTAVQGTSHRGKNDLRIHNYVKEGLKQGMPGSLSGTPRDSSSA